MCCCAAGGRVYDLLSAAVEAGIGEPVAASGATADHALLRLPLVNARHAAAAVAEGQHAPRAPRRPPWICGVRVDRRRLPSRRPPRAAAGGRGVAVAVGVAQERRLLRHSVGAGPPPRRCQGTATVRREHALGVADAVLCAGFNPGDGGGRAPSDPEGELCLVDVAEPLLPTAQVHEQLGAPTAFERALLGEAAAEERDAAAAPAMQICSCLLSVQRRRAEGGRLRSVTAAEEAAAAAAGAAAATSSDGVGRWAAAAACCRRWRTWAAPSAVVGRPPRRARARDAVAPVFGERRRAAAAGVAAGGGTAVGRRRVWRVPTAPEEVGAKAPEREPAPAVDGTPEAGASLGEKRKRSPPSSRSCVRSATC